MIIIIGRRSLMTEWNPQVVKLTGITRHPAADTLEMAEVLGGYVVIFKEGRFKEGDLAGYVPVDTVCSDHPEFEWLGDKKRIKAVRLRGVFSLGILAAAPEGMKEGDSIVDHYGLKKYVYEEEMPDVPGRLNANHASPPQGWGIPYYDLDSLRKSSQVLAEGEEVVITEKLDGSNAAFAYAPDAKDGDPLWVKSRNYYLKEDYDNMYWQAARNYNLKVALEDHAGLVFFGELYGHVKGFKYDCLVDQGKLTPKLRIFDIWDANKMKFLNWDEVEKITKEIGLETVPVLYKGPWKPGKELWSLAEGQSVLGNNVREGFVVRPAKERKNYRMERIIMKLKGETYLLKKG